MDSVAAVMESPITFPMNMTACHESSPPINISLLEPWWCPNLMKISEPDRQIIIRAIASLVQQVLNSATANWDRQDTAHATLLH
jgi:hypothetical protein